MSRFRKIAAGFELQPCLTEISRNWPLFDDGMDRLQMSGERDIKGRPSVPKGYLTLDVDPEEMPATFALAKAAVEVAHRYYGPDYGFDSRAPMLLACPPHSRVPPHRDGMETGLPLLGSGLRHQLALQCDNKAFFRIGQERARFKPGELWLCNVGDCIHEMRNDSDCWRIVLRFDIFGFDPQGRARVDEIGGFDRLKAARIPLERRTCAPRVL